MSQIREFASLVPPTPTVDTITTQDLVVVSPVGGNINIVGTNGITTTGAGNTVSVDLILTFTGNVGGAVTPFAGDIGIVGAGIITVTGDPLAGTLTISSTGGAGIDQVTTQDANVVIPVAGNINILGYHGINTEGLGATVGIQIDNAIFLGDQVNITGSDALTITTGSISIASGNLNLPATDSTGNVGLITWGGFIWGSVYGGGNIFLGKGAANLTLAVGTCNENIGIGNYIMSRIDEAQNNIVIGNSSANNLIDGLSNVAIGAFSFDRNEGSCNTVIGAGVLNNATLANYNCAIGWDAGSNYATTESSNVIISSAGVIGDSHTIRIGTQGNGNTQQNLCYIAGITGVNVGSVANVVSIATGTGQLGTTAITAGTGISVTPGANTITIASTDSGVEWLEITAAAAGMVVNTGYIANRATLVTLTLPATAAQGAVFEVTGKGVGGWLIAQNAGQTIYYGNTTTTPGAGGSLASTLRRDSIKLVCITADTEFNVLSSIGNITVV